MVRDGEAVREDSASAAADRAVRVRGLGWRNSDRSKDCRETGIGTGSRIATNTSTKCRREHHNITEQCTLSQEH